MLGLLAGMSVGERTGGPESDLATACRATVYMTVSINGGRFFVGVLIRRALLFGIHIRAPNFWNPHVEHGISTAPECSWLSLASRSAQKVKVTQRRGSPHDTCR